MWQVVSLHAPGAADGTVPQAVVAEVIGEMEDGDWDQGPVMSAAIMLD